MLGRSLRPRSFGVVDLESGQFFLLIEELGLRGWQTLASASLTDDDLRLVAELFIEEPRARTLSLAGGMASLAWGGEEQELHVRIALERERLRGRHLAKFRSAVLEARDKRRRKETDDFFEAAAKPPLFTTPEVQDLSEAEEPDPREQDEVEIGRDLAEREPDFLDELEQEAEVREEDEDEEMFDGDDYEEEGGEEMATKMKPVPKAPSKKKGPGYAPPKIGPGKKKKSAHARNGGLTLEGQPLRKGDVLRQRKSGLRHEVVGFADARTKVRLQALSVFSNQPNPRAVTLRSIAAHYTRA